MNTPDVASRLQRVRSTLATAWLEADPRALGLFRIFFGLLCSFDVLRRMQWIETFYSNSGTLSNHYNLYAPIFRDNISLLSGLSTPGEVTVFFVLTLICLFFFTIGYRTKLFQILSWLCVLSIHSRNTMLANGGDVVMNIWWIWTLWLPLGIRFSVDAVTKSLRTGSDTTPTALSTKTSASDIPVRSLAMFMVLWQLAIIYFFNTVHKGGQTWFDGTAIAYCFEQDRIVTGLGLWAKDTWPLWISQVMTWGTLVIEGLAPLLLLTPIFTRWARRLVILGLVSLHTGIWLLTDVGFFSPTMMVSFILLFCAADFDVIARLCRRLAGAPIGVWYDDSCGMCFRLARLGARLDRLGLITWYQNSDIEHRPKSLELEEFRNLTEETVIVYDPKSGAVFTAHRAIARIIRALPLGRFFAWIMLLPLIDQGLNVIYQKVSRSRRRMSAWFGYGQCGLTQPVEVHQVEQRSQVSGAHIFYKRIQSILITAGILFIFVATTSQALHENRFMRETVLKQTLNICYSGHRRPGCDYWQPKFLKSVVSYARIFQGWSMFAPNAPKKDGWLVIDARLSDGTRVDPQTGRTPEFTPADARKMSWDQFWGSYSMRIASGQHRKYRKGLIDWLRNSAIKRLTLEPGQKIRSVTVWWVGDKSPDPRVGKAPVITEKFIVTEWPKRKAASRNKSKGKSD